MYVKHKGRRGDVSVEKSDALNKYKVKREREKGEARES